MARGIEPALSFFLVPNTPNLRNQLFRACDYRLRLTGAFPSNRAAEAAHLYR